ncbi:MAG: hypothetical protein OXG78_11980 [Chloroflexi bacterium]|nr:hypothetical protein [Chloroflexota bacterium]
MRIELLLFLSFLALVIVMIACSLPRRPTPMLSPTLFPLLTLTTYDPQMVARVNMEAEIAATALPAGPNFPEVDISPPRCYRTGSPQLTCFGYLYNRAKSAISDINLAAQFSIGGDKPDTATVFSLEQIRVPAGGKAPYRLNMPAPQSDEAALEISLESAAVALATGPQLAIEDLSADYQQASNTYRLRGLLRNESDSTAEHIRLVVTLEDETGTIIGYRVQDLSGALAGKESRAIDVSVTPLEHAVEIRHRLIAQAVRAD